jgi:hypothetical protein
LQIGNNFFFGVFQIELTLCCHNFILNDIHDLITFITNKQNPLQDQVLGDMVAMATDRNF